MRLVDLEPRWWADAGRRGQGLTFICPHCRSVRLGVAFTNPLDGGPPHRLALDDQLRFVHGAEYSENPNDAEACWTRTGEDFETLTLAPSVDASRSGHWHGVIQDGETR